MPSTVTLPFWLFLLIIAFAAVAFFSHFLFPSVRWFFRRRMQRAVARLNARLDRPIQPFKLMKRHDMIVRLVHDPKVAETIAAEATTSGEPLSVVQERARRYAREIVPAFSATIYFGFAARAAKWLARLVYKVRVGSFDAGAFTEIDKGATVVFVMNHRSNMDYVLVTHLAAERSALSYAVGEWAQVWPLSRLIRASGAYFIRRRHSSPLYRRVLSRYVQMATEEGVTQAIFPEGGLSLTGAVGPAKLGILSYIVAGWRPGGRDVVFVPVALAYDRVIEDRVLVAAHGEGTRRFRAPLWSVLKFAGRQLRRALQGRFQKFGSAAVAYGAPVSLSAFLSEPRGDAVGELAADLMARIAGGVPVLPVPLFCAALGEDMAVRRDMVLERAEALADQLRSAGARLDLPEGGVAPAVAYAIELLTLRKVVTEDQGQLAVTARERGLIGFYAAAVQQHLSAPAA